MFAWMAWSFGYSIYSMVLRVFWMLVDDYWLSWWKDLISNFPLLSLFIFLLVCLPVLIHQLQNSTTPPSSTPEPITVTNITPTNTIPPSSTPEPITVTNITPTNSTIDRNVTGDSNNMSKMFDSNSEVIDQPKINTNVDVTVVEKANEDDHLVTKPNPSIVVIGSQFCSNSKIELTITRKTKKSIYENFSVKDGNGKIIFKIKEGDSCFHVRRILVDAAGRSILSMERKIKSTHKRWQAFKGDSRNIEDLLFTTKRTIAIQFRTKLEVFLASNANEAICDFVVQTRWSDQSCQIYGAGRSGILAQMNKDLIPSVGNDTYMVTVYPNIDYAFIVTLIFILDTINNVLR